MSPLRGRHVRRTAIGLVALAVIGAGTAYGVGGGGSAARYRTVAATRADVEQTLSTSGVVDARDRADLAFATSGTIAALEVTLGQQVTTGQVIARLETGSLDAAVTQAQAALAKAVAQLASDRTAQSTAVSNASSSTPSSSSSGSNNGSSSSAALLAALKGLQDKVIAAQGAASAALAAANTALAAQNSACATAFTTTPTASPTDSPTDAPSTGPDPADAACTTALAAVQAAQTAVAKAQNDLAQALNALSGALTRALGGSGGTGKPTSSARTTATTSTRPSSTGASSPSASGASGATITAARLASDQAQIYQAQADLITAQQNRAQAVVRSTRSGRVVALDKGVGDAVSAGTTVATVVGGTAVTILGTVPETQIGSVKLGQVVRVSVPGVTRTTTGTVSAISLVPDTSSGTTSYPVTVTVEAPTISLPTGSNALLQIVLATSRDVVTVPTSAVVRNGTSGTVQTWDGKTLATKRVTLGAIGARRVVIASGLTAGTAVVLAAMDQPIKGASSTLNNRGNFPTFSFRRAGGAGGAGGFGGPASFSKAGG